MASLSTSAARPLRLVVKHTFLDFDEASPVSAARGNRRAVTDSRVLQKKGSGELPGYEPGRFSDEETTADEAAPEVEASVQAPCKVLKKKKLTVRFADLLPEPVLSAPFQPQPSSPAQSVESTSSGEVDSAVPPLSRKLRREARKAELIRRGAQLVCRKPAPQQRQPPADSRTTVMLRNLPNNYTRDMLLSTIDRQGFRGDYDFLYLPIDFRKKSNLGYCFINFVDASRVQDFWNVFEGFNQWVLPTLKASHMSWSDPHQGLSSHLERYRNSSVMHPSVPDKFKPVLFVNGVRVSFPEPTRPLQEPQWR